MSARVMTDYLQDKLKLGVGLRGINYFTEERLTRFVRELQSFTADGRGFDFHTHSVGNRAVFEGMLRAINVLDISLRGFDNA